jgi:hypothetical protein
MFKSLVASGVFLGFGLLMCTPSWGAGVPPCVDGNTAGYLCVTPPASIAVQEGSEVISTFSFQATNYTGYTLVVDDVDWAITALGPDLSDTIVTTGFGTWDTGILNGDTDTFTWSMIMPNPPGCDLTGCDYGVNQVSFSVNTDYIYPPSLVTVLGLSTVNGSTNTVAYVVVSDAPVPEPFSALMLGPALALLGCAWRRRRPR